MQNYLGRAVLTLDGLFRYDVVVTVGLDDDGNWTGQLVVVTQKDAMDLAINVDIATAPWQLTYDKTTVMVEISADHDEFYRLTRASLDRLTTWERPV